MSDFWQQQPTQYPSGQPTQPPAFGNTNNPWPAQPGYPNGFPAPTRRPAGSKNRWWFIGGGATFLVVLTVVFVSLSGGESAKPAAQSPLPSTPAVPSYGAQPTSTPASSRPESGDFGPADLKGLLLTPVEIGEIEQGSGMAAGEVSSSPLDVTTDPGNCAGVFYPATAAAYAGSGFTGIAAQSVHDPGDKPAHRAVQAVISFSSPRAAQAFVDAQFSAWQQCHFTWVTAHSPDGGTERLEVAAPGKDTGANTIVAAIMDPHDRSGAGCEHGMTVQANVVIDARGCSPHAGSDGTTIAHRIQRAMKGQ